MAITLPLLMIDVNGLFHKALFHGGFMQGLSIPIYVYWETMIHGVFMATSAVVLISLPVQLIKFLIFLSLLFSLLYCSLRTK